MSTALFDTVRTSAKITPKILVGISGGKDSAVTLDLCSKYFDTVQPFFMYLVKGLDFQEVALRYYEQKYGLDIIRVPHFMLSDFFRYGTLRAFDLSVPIVKIVELYNYLRELTGIYWIAGGERIKDSIVRRAMIKESSAIDDKRGRIYPLAYWNKAEVLNYLKINKIPLSLETRILGFSFRSFMSKEIMQIKYAFPKDYARIKEWFPLIDASTKRGELYQKQI